MVEPSIGLDDIERLDFSKGGGLLPAIVQDVGSRTVLMLGYMNREALHETLRRGRVVFFSRSRQRLWEKGETSGHTFELDRIFADCDGDSLLITARPKGPACHKGTGSCFGNSSITERDPLRIVSDLEQLIAQRMLQRPQGSYTAALFESGISRIAQKVGEEALEVALAAVAGSDAQVLAEFSDLLYHLLVLLRARGLCLEQIARELRDRHTRTQPLAG